MLILGLESSCDETGAAVIKTDKNKKELLLLSNVVASSLSLHGAAGGIIPESAAREQVRYIVPVIKEALQKAKIKPSDLDAIAVTHGPGLIGSLLIGVETAKTLSYVWDIPLIPTNHLFGHLYANWIEATPKLPAIGLIVSGGHTDLVLIKNHGNIKWIGGTKDDAAGEALDKIGRLLGLPYPGGPYIEKAAKEGDADRFNFPTPLNDKSFDFSFSGLKTAVLREVESQKKLDSRTINDICANVQKVIINILIKKTLRAAEKYQAESIILGGGVIANQTLKNKFESTIQSQMPNVSFFAPSKQFCTDNAAMIAASAVFNNKTAAWQKVDADPGLYF